MAWPVSATTQPALQEQAARLAAHVRRHPQLDPVDIGFTLAKGRTGFARRAVVVGRDRAELLQGLEVIATGAGAPNVVGAAARARSRPVLVFPGQGTQWVGMAGRLLDTSPLFVDQLAACQRALEPFVDWRLEDVLSDEAALARVDVVQPALWAVMVSLAALWRTHGVQPAAVVGHSQGEIAAATVAGALSLADGALVVARRSKAILALSGRGGMLSVALPRRDVELLVRRWAGRVGVAAVNGPALTVVSGQSAALDELFGELTAQDVRVNRLPVDYASHSEQVEELGEELISALSPITPRTGTVPFHSALTGELLDTRRLDADYWYRSLRQPVEFEAAVRDLVARGHDTFLEASPHPVLTAGVQQILDESAEAGVALGTLRRGDGGPDRFLLSVAEAHAHGVEVDWDAAFPSGAFVELPAYAFQTERFWMLPTRTAADAAALGLRDANHPLLGAAVPPVDGDGRVFTGRLSRQSHPWLVDHAVDGAVLLPGTAMLELALHAGRHTGWAQLDELILEDPLVLSGQGSVELRLAVGAPDESDRRAVVLHSRSADGSGPQDSAWIRHAVGSLSRAAGPADGDALAAWPPAGAREVPLDDVYRRLAERGYEYGPAFQGLQRLWQLGDEHFAQVALPSSARGGAAEFGLHPAVLDAALHPLLIDPPAEPDRRLLLPFSWSGVRLHATGAATLRVRLSPAAGPDAYAIAVADATGAPVASVESLTLRPVRAGSSGFADSRLDRSLFQVDWAPLSAGPTEAAPPTEVLRVVSDPAADVADAVRTTTADVLRRIQNRLADGSDSAARLAVVTCGAVAVRQGEAPDLAQAAVWGLVRSAQAEHPDRIVLIDVDDQAADIARAAVVGGEPQVAVRAGRLFAPRLSRADAADGRFALDPDGLDPDGTVLITGGVGGLGGLIARHLATEHGVRHLVLIGRRGGDSPGAAGLAAELEACGAHVTIAACDVADREQLRAVLTVIPARHPLTSVIHAAGVLDDCTVEQLTARQLETVLRPKVDGAWNLHLLTQDTDAPLPSFVLFSSVAGVIGTAGQANYAAANAFLDALAQRRRAEGLAGISLAWGLWEQDTGLTRGLDRTDRARLARQGLAPLPRERGLRAVRPRPDAERRARRARRVGSRRSARCRRDRAATGALPLLA